MNVTYEGTDRSVSMDKQGKPTASWMHGWTQDQRDAKFLEFCHAFDRREDSLLFNEYQIFSHRLHWHEHPFVETMGWVNDPVDRLMFTLIFSFSNEHWGTLTHVMSNGIDQTREHFKQNRHARSDLFQIYYPKGTDVKEWLLTGPLKAAEALKYTICNGKRYTMMQFAKILEKHFKEQQGFRSPLYPCKNAARYMAMAYPEIVDPESVLYGGTGHFDGLFQLTGEEFNGRCKYEIDADGEFVPKNEACSKWLNWMNHYANHTGNPMTEQKLLNIEDKTCFFYKHIAISHGVKSPTKRIPYNWIFPTNFDLANHPDGKVVLDGNTTRHLWDENYNRATLEFTEEPAVV